MSYVLELGLQAALQEVKALWQMPGKITKHGACIL